MSRRAGWRRPILVAGAAIALAATAWAALGGAGSGGPGAGPAAPGDPVAQDRPAPAFTSTLLSDAGSLSLSSYRGSVVVVNFWASWCRACRREAPALETLWESYRDRGVRFLGVDYEDGRSAAVAAARSFGMRYPSVTDPDGTVADAFGVFGLPTTYIVGPDGRIRYVVAGRIRPASFRAALDSVPAGTQPEAAAP